MFTGELLYGLNAGLIAACFGAALLLATEVGFWMGHRRGGRLDEAAKGQVGTIQAAQFALLGLFLAFTFSMAATRYDARKRLVLDEANAIGTAYLRASLLSKSDREKAELLLRRYVDARLEFYDAGDDVQSVQTASRKAELIQQELWSHAAALGRQQPEAVTLGLYLRALNDVFDLYAKQGMAFENHVPETILFFLFFISTVVLGEMGYLNGLRGRRHFWVSSLLSVLVTVTLLLILDLDRPRRGLIQVSAKSMKVLRDSLRKAAPSQSQGIE